MKKNVILLSYILLCLVCSTSCTNAQTLPPTRVIGSPYPFSSQPDTLYAVNPNAFNDSAMLAIETLQGLLAKTKPAIYQARGSGYALWLADFINHGVVVDSTYWRNESGLMHHFSSKIKGYILCHPDDSTANAAISLCGIKNAIAISTADTALMDTLGIPMLYDVRGKGPAWILANFDTSFSNRIITYQVVSKDLFLGDYSVFAKALHFFDPIGSSTQQAAFARMKPQSALLGWGTDEHSMVTAATQSAINVHAADWSANISTLTNFNTPPVKQLTHSIDTQTIANRHTVCFVMTDGDNIQWALGDFMGSNQWYGNPNRGKVNLGWTVSPALAELAPTVLNYFYQHATNTANAKDYFVAAPSGLGYVYPDVYPTGALDSECVLTNRYMAKADLNILNILANTSGAYLNTYLNQSNIDAIFLYEFNNYSGLAGQITCINGKPVIGGRYNLWSGFETTASLAAKLNALAKTPYSENGYSLIPVNVWTMNVDSVNKCVSLLDSTVRVVTPDVFVKLITHDVCAPTATTDINHGNHVMLFPPAPNPFSTDAQVSYYLPNETSVRLTVYNMLGQEVEVLQNNIAMSTGLHSVALQNTNLAPGVYFIQMKTAQQILVQRVVKN